MTEKKYVESKTIWASATLLISSAVSVALHFFDVSPLTPEMLGGAITGAITGIVFLILRIVTKQPVGPQNEGNGANATTNVLFFLLFIALMSGCTTIQAKKSIDMKIKAGPPCVVVIDVDGEKAVEVTGPNKCKVSDGRQ
tara:strand:+ start:150 stop:569 length:420 start_codon:yes stop_codon:yes gene_type:complete